MEQEILTHHNMKDLTFSDLKLLHTLYYETSLQNGEDIKKIDVQKLYDELIDVFSKNEDHPQKIYAIIQEFKNKFLVLDCVQVHQRSRHSRLVS